MVLEDRTVITFEGGYNLGGGTEVLGAKNALYFVLDSGYICTDSSGFTPLELMNFTEYKLDHNFLHGMLKMKHL